MEPAKAKHNTLVEKTVLAMWKEFEAGHEKLIVESINQFKPKINLTAENIQMIKADAMNRMQPLLDDMSQTYASYRLTF